MSGAQHTPGPWHWRDAAGAGLGIYGDVRATMGEKFTDVVNIFGLDACGPPRFQIAYERWVQFPKREWDEMQRANAALMAAAPEMLSALLLLTASTLNAPSASVQQKVGLERAQAAIAKATGNAS